MTYTPFPVAVEVQQRLAKGTSPAVTRILEGSNDFPTTDKTAQAAPIGEEVLRRAAGFWKAKNNANGRVLIDRKGGRNHAYAGGNRIAFFAHGALQLPGVAGNYASTPNGVYSGLGAEPLATPRDGDFRVHAALDSWTPASTMALFAKWQNTVTQSYLLSVTSTGALQFQWSTTGTNTLTAVSTATLGLANFEVKWVRATIDCNNGAGGYTVTFYTSDDNKVWDQLGDPVVGVGTTVVAYSNSNVEFGSRLGGSSWNAAGKIFRVQLYRGTNDQIINGELLMDIDFGHAPDGATSFNDRDALIVPFQGFRGRGTTFGPNSVRVPNEAAFDVTDLDVRYEMTFHDFNNGLASFGGRASPAGSPPSWLSWNIQPYFLLNLERMYVFVQWVINDAAFVWGVNLFQLNCGYVPVKAGERFWFRVTLDVDDGAGNKVARLYKSTDGVHWQQYGETVEAGTTVINPGSAGLELGTFASGNWNFSGMWHKFDWRDALDGDALVTLDFTDKPPNYSPIQDEQGRDWLIPDISRTITVHQTAVGSAEPKYLAFTPGDRYVWLPGVVGNYLSSPALSSPGDDFERSDRVLDGDNGWAELNGDWEIIDGAAEMTAIAGPGILYHDSELTGHWEMALTLPASLPVTSTYSVVSMLGTCRYSAPDTLVYWGVQTFWEPDGVTWLGSNVYVIANHPSVGNTIAVNTVLATPLVLGQDLDIEFTLDGIGNADLIVNGEVFYGFLGGAPLSALTATAAGLYSGHDPTNPTIAFVTPTLRSYVGPGITSPFEITGDIDLRVEVAMEDWTPAATQLLLARRSGSAAAQGSYWFYVNTNGTLAIEWSNGTSNFSMVSTAAVGGTDKQALHVRATLDVDNGSSQRVARFYKSTDGIAWTQIGSTVTTAGVTSIRAGTEILEIGSQYTGTSGPLAGKIYGAKVFRGIDGTLVFEFDAATDLATAEAPYHTVAASTEQIVTVNRADTGLKAVVVDRPLFVLGTNDYFEVADVAEFDFAATDDMSVAVMARTYGLPAAADEALVAKRAAASGTSAGWDIYTAATETTPRIAIGDGTTAVSAVMPLDTTTGDDFERTDRALDADNGWDAASSYQIVDGAAYIDSVSDVFDQYAIHAGAATGTWELHTTIPNPIPTMDPGSLLYTADLQIVGLWTSISGFDGLLCRVQLRFEPDGTWSGGTIWVDYDSPTEGSGTVFNQPLVTTTLSPGDAVLFTVELDALGNITLEINGESFGGTVPADVLADLPTTNWGLGAVRNFTGGLIDSDTPPVEEFVGPGFTADPAEWRAIVGVRDANLTGYLNGATGTPVTDTTTGSLANSEAVRFGRLSGAGTAYAAMEFAGAAIWREALTADDAGRLRTEMAT